MGLYARAMRRIGRTRWAIAVARRALHPLDAALLKVSRGRLHAGPVPTLLLTTRRDGGRAHRVPLFFTPEGAAAVVADFNAGRRRPPLWARNLIADPEAVIEVRGRATPVHARLLEGEERAGGLAALERLWPGYAEVTAMADRSIHAFRLDPRSPGGEAGP